MLIRREAILFELESTYRDSTTADATDAVFVFDANWSNDAKTLQRQGPSDTLASFQSIYGGRTATMTFKCELKGNGTPGGSPEFGKLLQACGMGKVTVPDTSVTYNPETSDPDSGVLYYYQDGKLKIMRGVRGTAKFVLQAREYGYVEFTMHGHPDAEVDSGIIDPNYDSTVPPQVVGGAVAIGGTSIEVTKVEIDLQNEIAKPLSINEANGVGQIRIASRDISGMIDPESVLVATIPFENDWTSNNSQAFTTGVIGSTAGNRYEITSSAAYYKDIQEGEREGIRTQEIQMGFAESSGDDEIAVIFT